MLALRDAACRRVRQGLMESILIGKAAPNNMPQGTERDDILPGCQEAPYLARHDALIIGEPAKADAGYDPFDCH
jgi:hypothetical protein